MSSHGRRYIFGNKLQSGRADEDSRSSLKSLPPKSRLQSLEYDVGRSTMYQIQQGPDHYIPPNSPPTSTPSPAFNVDKFASKRAQESQRKPYTTKSTTLLPNTSFRAIRCDHLKSRVTIEKLSGHFKQCIGYLHSYLPVRNDGDLKGYGVITFNDGASAKMAMETMSGTKVCGRQLTMLLTHPMTKQEVRFSHSTDPSALSAKELHHKTKAIRRLDVLDALQRDSDRDQARRRLRMKGQTTERQNSRAHNLAKLIGEAGLGYFPQNLDAYVQDIDNTYGHESEVRRNCRIYYTMFEKFSNCANKVTTQRVQFKDKSIFKPSTDDDESMIKDRKALFGWIAHLAENARKIRLLRKPLNKGLDLPEFVEMSYETDLREARGWMVHDLETFAETFVNWDHGYEACFSHVDELVARMELFKKAVMVMYDDLKKDETFEEDSGNQVSAPREWAVVDVDSGPTDSSLGFEKARARKVRGSFSKKQDRGGINRSFQDENMAASKSLGDLNMENEGMCDSDLEDPDFDEGELDG
ncbi:hypothetical protein DL95DRAFT_462301 [Leptodontidium sp. 2 PMI_412]|nr:hypothetical protein DL95DRAFT_462301 [Leptodontidium sp. 2 PMI_412]